MVGEHGPWENMAEPEIEPACTQVLNAWHRQNYQGLACFEE